MREDSAATSFRQKRLVRFLSLIDPTRETSILDIGGTLSYWKALEHPLYKSPKVRIRIINTGADEFDDENIEMRSGDACDLSEYPDNSFDIVHSNSVIEHVGDWRKMVEMALEVRRVAPVHFVQTPNFWFPIEPHFRLPVVHWLPRRVRIPIIQAALRTSRENAIRNVDRIHLVSKSEMRILFPDSDIWEEKFFGFAKSLVAIRRSPTGFVSAT